MRNCAWGLAALMLSLLNAGCAFGPTVDTVPWWKGLPSMLIEPTSLEGMVWRDHFRAKLARRSRPVDFQTGEESSWIESEWLEPIPAGGLESELPSPSPAETTAPTDSFEPNAD